MVYLKLTVKWTPRHAASRYEPEIKRRQVCRLSVMSCRPGEHCCP